MIRIPWALEADQVHQIFKNMLVQARSILNPRDKEQRAAGGHINGLISALKDRVKVQINSGARLLDDEDDEIYPDPEDLDEITHVNMNKEASPSALVSFFSSLIS